MNIINEWMIKLLISLTIAIVIHEFGHWFYFKRLGKNVKITFEDMAFSVGDEKDYVDLTKKQKVYLFWYGIYFGLFPIFFLSLYSPLYLWILPLYLIGCKSDIDELVRLENE